MNDKDINELASHFIGRTAIEKGALFANAVFQTSQENAKVLVNGLDKQLIQAEKEDVDKLTIENILFTLYRSARLIFELLAGDARDEFMDALLVETCNILRSKMHYNEKQINGLLSLYESATEEYAKYKDGVENTGLLKGTLYWEYGKRIAELVRQPEDAFVVHAAIKVFHVSWMNVGVLLKKVLEI